MYLKLLDLDNSEITNNLSITAHVELVNLTNVDLLLCLILIYDLYKLTPY